jgi:hypothetical protein
MLYPFIKSLHDLFMVLLSGYEEDYMLTAFVITISMPVHKCCIFVCCANTHVEPPIPLEGRTL